MNYACMLFILITVCYSPLAPIMVTHAGLKSDVGGGHEAWAHSAGGAAAVWSIKLCACSLG